MDHVEVNENMRYFHFRMIIEQDKQKMKKLKRRNKSGRERRSSSIGNEKRRR